MGEELVSDEVTAIMELIKNSYDADATWVRVTIDSKNKLSGDEYHYKGDRTFIMIEDNGFGMDEEDIKTGWMVISVSKKRELKAQGKKTPKGRTPLGDKGLGRLSTQRLGQRLEMHSTKVNDKFINHLAFDWNNFKENIPITKVNSFFNKESKEGNKHWTKLIITKLKEPKIWEGSDRDRFIGQISQLIFPYKEQRPFNVYLHINGERFDLDEITEALREQAVARFRIEYLNEQISIKGNVKIRKLVGGAPKQADRDDFEKLIEEDSGKNFFDFLTDKISNKKYFLDKIKYSGKAGTLFSFDTVISTEGLGLEKIHSNELEKEILANPGYFYGEIDDFYFTESETLSSTFDTLAQFKKIAQNQAGIRIFRDGFGIRPFGIDAMDWLQLGKEQTSGASFYNLRPHNVIGFISISADENKFLKEKTDREGFTDTPYSRNFLKIVRCVIEQINSLYVATRRSYNEYKRRQAEQKGGIRDIKDSVKRLQTTSENAKKIQKENLKFSENLEEVSSSVKLLVKKVSQDSIRDQKELFQQIDNLLNDAKKLVSRVDLILEVAKKLQYDADYIQPKVNDLENQLSEFAELAGLGLTAEALSHEISNIVDRLLEQTNAINIKIKGKDSINTSIIYVYVEFVNSSIKSFRKQLSHLAPSLRYIRETKEEIDVENYINEIVEYYRDRFEDEIKIIPRISGNNFAIKMSKGKLTQVIDNIILNSQYWLRERLKRGDNFNPKITIEIAEPLIKIYDNGFGIEPAYEERIFQPFVTSKPKNVGRGLGLFIVKQLLETVGSEVLLLNKRNEFYRKYIFQINLSSIIL